MIQVKFKNLERSELALEAVVDRIESIVEKFEDLRRGRIIVTVEMDNSPAKSGPDVFNVKLHIPNGRYRGVTVTKSDSNMYKALADLADHMLEKLNRTGDRERVKERKRARKIATIVDSKNQLEEESL